MELNKTNEINEPPHSTAQPFIIGNINATNLFTSHVEGSQTQNGLLIPPGMVGLPTTVNNTQVIGILPVFIQGSNIPSGIQSSQVVYINNLLNVNRSIDNNSLGPSTQTVSSSSSQQPRLVSSDTVILPSTVSNLASADTLTLLPTPSEIMNNKNPTQTDHLETKQRSSTLQTAFSLVSGLSNRSVDLESIPTMNLFKTDLKKEKAGSQVDAVNASISILQSTSSDIKNNLVSSPSRYQTRSKTKKERNSASESDTNRLQIDESVHEDTDSEFEETFPKAGEKKENSLTRDDTIILPTTCQSSSAQNQSSLSVSDTLILSSFNSQVNSSNTLKSVTSSAGFSVETHGSNGPLNSTLSISDNSTVKPSVPSLSSIPTLMLTDSIVEGTVNPALLCDLLSQPSSSRISSVKSITLDQLLSNPDLITSLQNSVHGTSSPVSIQNSTQANSMVDTNRIPSSKSITLEQLLSNPDLLAFIQNSMQGTPLSVSLQNSMPATSLPVSLQNSTQVNSMNTASQIPSIKSITLDELLSNADLIASLQNSIHGTSLPVSLQNSMMATSSPVHSQNSLQGTSQMLSSNMSVKGTQTDWVFGKMPITFSPPTTSQPVENIEEQSVNLGNMPLVVEETTQYQISFQTNDPCVTRNSSEDNGEAGHAKLLFKCIECEESFASKQELLKHEKYHKKVLKCDLCTSTFTRMGNYTRHRKIHNLKPDQKLFTCTQCGREFLQRCDLRRHMLIHSNQEPYRCDICNKGYIRRSDLVVHKRFHTKERVFKCNACDKSFFQSGDLSRHVRRAHKPGSQLTCGHCERKYACEITLIRHMKVFHKDIILNSVNNNATEPE